MRRELCPEGTIQGPGSWAEETLTEAVLKSSVYLNRLETGFQYVAVRVLEPTQEQNNSPNKQRKEKKEKGKNVSARHMVGSQKTCCCYY